MAVEEPVPEPVVLEELGGDPRPFVTRRRLGSAPEVRSRHPGAFFRIEFAAPVAGRLAFGFACHLGLGLFRHDRAGER